MTDEQQAQRHREEVLTEFGTWRLTADPDAPAAEEVRTLETLLRLKAEKLDSPDPGMWSEDLATDLLTEVVPRTVIQPREQVMDMVPLLVRFVGYLRESGRWHPEAMSVTEAPGMLADLEFAALEAADDPSRRTFSTNILGYGLGLGVDLEDEEELAAFMHWYNSLPDDERITLSSTGRLAEPSRPYDRDAALAAVRDGGQAGLPWPQFLPAPETDTGEGLLTDLDQSAEAYAAHPVVRRAVALLEVVGQGRRVTATGALTRADAAEVLRVCELEGTARSMWDRPEIVGPWIALRDGGWLEVRGDRAVRGVGPVPYVPLTEDPEAFVDFGHALLTSLLLGRQAREADDGGFAGMPDSLAAVLISCREGGLTMPGPDQVHGQERQRWGSVLTDLRGLARVGALEGEGLHFTGSGVLLSAALVLLRERS